MVTVFVGCGEKKYSIKMNDENWLYEKLPSSAKVGEKVTVKIKFATDMGYIFMVNGERINQDDNVESNNYWQFSFTMPDENVVIDFKTYDGFLPTPEYGTLIETYWIQNPKAEYVRVREYYGEYGNGALVAMIDAEEYTSNVWSEEVAGYNFVYSDGNRLKVLYNDKFYTLPEAHQKGYLTKENIENIFSEYCANFENRDIIKIGAYIVSSTGEEIRVRDIDNYKEYTVSLSFCVDHTVKEGAFYWITGILDSEANHITVEFPDNFHCPQRYAHTEEGDLQLYAYAVNVTDVGMTVRFECANLDDGELQTGSWYDIEKYENGEWRKVEAIAEVYWNALLYLIKENDVTEFDVNWELLYGKLSPGYYRINKEITKFKGTGVFDKIICSAPFVIA